MLKENAHYSLLLSTLHKPFLYVKILTRAVTNFCNIICSFDIIQMPRADTTFFCLLASICFPNPVRCHHHRRRRLHSAELVYCYPQTRLSIAFV